MATPCTRSRPEALAVRLRRLHDWDLTPREAIALQQRLHARLELSDRLPRLGRVAGVDVGFDAARGVARAAVVVLEWPGLERLEHRVAQRVTDFPYVPGLLAFRELPAIVAAVESLHTAPDVFFCDGHGIAHPRRFGIACHLGLLADRPAIGVGKSRLVGAAAEPGRERGARVSLLDRGEVVGAVLRTRTAVRPVFVSPGHRVGLETAIELVLRAAPRYRLPEPIRAADRLASARG